MGDDEEDFEAIALGEEKRRSRALPEAQEASGDARRPRLA
jgi:hypothetical protein